MKNTKIPKLNLESTKQSTFQNTSPYTSRELENIKQNTDNYIIDNNILFNKLVDVQNELRELRNIINTLHFPKPINYNYPHDSDSYSSGTIYCTPPLESNLTNYIKNKNKK